MNLIPRVKNISLTPRSEWEVIGPETTTLGEMYTRYIIPLAAIGPAASFIGMSVFGLSLPFAGAYRVPLSTNLSMQLTNYVVALVTVYLIALLIDGLAPSFGGQRNRIQALKLAAYAYTPAWVAGILLLVPSLGGLAVLAGLYSLYVFYLGVMPMMKVPEDKAVGFTAATVVCALVLGFVGGAVTGAIFGASMLTGSAALP
ncbi:Yip1 family protein [Massilia norwichensis]|jgi:Yip1 domain|uniref:YIP1 family protein n=1 Tax=Massilia norwichensis TaxID=1442366 RepID=A0ABT2AEF5_9BURK|nr:Yip1 family protein [Massilia norwichensis]MCS0592532.1 YIP1 family protein [Massilia norwichensis]